MSPGAVITLAKLSNKDSRFDVEDDPSLAEVGEGEEDYDSEEENKEVDYPVNYNENFAPDSESVRAVLKINGAHKQGGFRIVPPDQTNREAEMFCLLWKDSGDVDCVEPNKVILGGEANATLTFEDNEDFKAFSALHANFGPKKECFMGINRSIVPRVSTYVKPRSSTQKVREDTLDETKFLLFNVRREKYIFFRGQVWLPHQCALELIEHCNLWSVTVQTEESFNNNQNPDEIFLLQSVE